MMTALLYEYYSVKRIRKMKDSGPSFSLSDDGETMGVYINFLHLLSKLQVLKGYGFFPAFEHVDIA